MYDKDEINAAAMLYSVTGEEEDFAIMLAAAAPMLEIILRKYYKYKTFFPDIRQEVFLHMIKRWQNPNRLRPVFDRMIPSQFFYSFFRGAVVSGIRKTVDTSFGLKGETILTKHHSKSYDVYSWLVTPFGDLSNKERLRLLDSEDIDMED